MFSLFSHLFHIKKAAFHIEKHTHRSQDQHDRNENYDHFVKGGRGADGNAPGAGGFAGLFVVRGNAEGERRGEDKTVQKTAAAFCHWYKVHSFSFLSFFYYSLPFKL